MYFRKKQSGGRVYLRIVENRRTGDQVRQQESCRSSSANLILIAGDAGGGTPVSVAAVAARWIDGQ